jgi:hypothetical protein
VSTRDVSDRDQDTTPFSGILSTLCAAAGARSAVLVDAEGETVDYAGRGDPFDIRILAAEWRLILHRLSEAAILGPSFEFVVRARHKSFLVESLPEGYALVIELGRRATGASDRALSEARKALISEAGFPEESDPRGSWAHVAVEEEPGHSRRPVLIKSKDEERQEVTIIGTIPTPDDSREVSYRVRLDNGLECTLVREPLGHWYLEEEEWSPPSRIR